MRGADYVIKRAFFALVTIYVAITINFFLFRVLPGNAVTDLARVPHAGPQLRHALTVEFGLNKPKWEQYLIYLRELAHGNMGISFAYALRHDARTLRHQAGIKRQVPVASAGSACP